MGIEIKMGIRRVKRMEFSFIEQIIVELQMVLFPQVAFLLRRNRWKILRNMSEEIHLR
jgi:hypothetical protein